MKTDVLIVGAGPTGLMAASLLTRNGIKCRLIDKGSDQARESRAIGIQAKSMELFHSMGLVDKFLARGQMIKGVKAYLRGKEKFSLNFSDMARKDTPYPFVFILPQSETESILIEDLKNHSIVVERQTTLLDFNQKEDFVEAIVLTAEGKKEVIQARFMVGCDGAHSIVKEKSNLEFKGASYASQFIMSDASVEWEFDHEHLRVFIDPGSIGVFFPIKGEDSSRVLTVREVDLEPDTRTTTSYPASILEIEKNFAEVSHQKNLRLKNPTWVTKYHVHHRCVDKLQVGRVFLAGDAAHIHSPAGAQGMNTGLQDASNLCWKLARVIKTYSDISLLETYHQERWPVAQKVLHFTDRFFSVATSRNKNLIKLRDTFFPVVMKLLMNKSFGRKFIFSFVSQLGIHYHSNPVVARNAGRRVPNFELGDGRKAFDLLTPVNFHLFVFGDEELKEIFPGTKIHHLKKCPYKSKGLLLVRPDGYSAFVSDSINEKNMKVIRSMLSMKERREELFSPSPIRH